MAESLRELVERVREARRAQPGCQCADGNSVCMRCHDLFESERACLDALLTSRAVEAVEVLRAWGRAIKDADAACEAVPDDAEPTCEQQAKYDDAFWRAVAAKDRARELANALADRLAAKGGE